MEKSKLQAMRQFVKILLMNTPSIILMRRFLFNGSKETREPKRGNENQSLSVMKAKCMDGARRMT